MMADEEFSPDDIDSALDEAEDNMEDEEDIREGQLDSMSATYPEQQQKQDIFNWFWKVTRLKKPFQLVKVGNLQKTEIGQANIPAREAMNLWVLGHTFGHPTFGNYFAQNAKITSATSMSRNGWFMDLSISQKRVRARSKSSGSEPWRVFSKNKKFRSNHPPEED